MIASLLLPPEALEASTDARAREAAALQAAWAELDAAHRLLTAHGVGPGSLPERLAQALRPALDTRDRASLDLLDSLVDCALTVRQLCEDTGRPEGTVRHGLDRLRQRGFVWREQCGTVWVYRLTSLGRQALRGGR